ncbi:MAG: DUF4065 domain-containing protein [Lachnospiraceae bacterium]|nr:DUF4065 domain-containing protein [Lachnospiraceae bacterium]
MKYTVKPTIRFQRDLKRIQKRGHYSLMNLENLNVREEVSCNYDSMLHVYPSKNMDYSILSNDEKEILDKVIAKFKNYKAKEI